MKDKEKAPSQMGLLNLPRSAAHPNDKVLKIFNKLKRRETKSPVKPNLKDEVVKTD